MDYKKNIGSWGENVAEEYLIRSGYQILRKNYRTPYGEIDLIARKETTIIFVEVKTRLSINYGLPEEGVTYKKQTHMVSAAEAYLQDNNNWAGDWRIDVIAIRKNNNQPAEITHFENALH